MIRHFTGTTAAELQQVAAGAQRSAGSGLVFTLVVVADAADSRTALAALARTVREHPCRVLLVTDGRARADRLDATVRSGEDAPGEIITVKFQGEFRRHRQAVVLPLLLPDLPVIVWWPGNSPQTPGQDPIGRLGTRRITDAMGARDPLAALELRARRYCAGDTDLTWTRLTRWRGLLAAALDAHPLQPDHARITASPDNAAAVLLAAWLADRLEIGVEVAAEAGGIGITAVVLSGPDGELEIRRGDGNLATVTVPGMPGRLVALPRRDLNTLLTEELRRLDDDPIYAEAMAALVRRVNRGSGISGEATE